MGGLLEDCGRIVEELWEDCGRVVGGLWEDCGWIAGGIGEDCVRIVRYCGRIASGEDRGRI